MLVAGDALFGATHVSKGETVLAGSIEGVRDHDEKLHARRLLVPGVMMLLRLEYGPQRASPVAHVGGQLCLVPGRERQDPLLAASETDLADVLDSRLGFAEASRLDEHVGAKAQYQGPIPVSRREVSQHLVQDGERTLETAEGEAVAHGERHESLCGPGSLPDSPGEACRLLQKWLGGRLRPLGAEPARQPPEDVESSRPGDQFVGAGLIDHGSREHPCLLASALVPHEVAGTFGVDLVKYDRVPLPPAVMQQPTGMSKGVTAQVPLMGCLGHAGEVQQNARMLADGRLGQGFDQIADERQAEVVDPVGRHAGEQ